MFWAKLARTVFHCDVPELKERLDSERFAYWKAVHLNEPWGDEWQQTALLAMLLNNAWFERKQKVSDFMPLPDFLRDPPDPKDLERQFKLIAWQQKVAAAMKAGQHKRAKAAREARNG